MSEFSELLAYYIHSKDIKTYALAQYCGLDRSNMYKIINGKRKPNSSEMVNKICKFLHLLPAEEAELQEAYQISLLGHDNYYRRKDVLKFFSEFNPTQSSFSEQGTTSVSVLNTSGTIVLNSRNEINHALSHIILLELTKDTGHLRLLFQPDFEYIMAFLAAESSSAANTRIDHIICLNNNSMTTHSHRNYNLNCLRQVLPLYGTIPMYNCCYYYDNITSKTDSIGMFPYIVISEKYACLLSADIQKGYLTSDPASINLFKSIFDKYINRLTPLLKRIDNIFAQLEYITAIMAGENTAYSFQMTPCLTPFITNRIMEKYIIHDIPNRALFIEKFKNYTQKLTAEQKSNNITYIFSINGILHFMETGKIGEYPADAYMPLDMSDRIYLLRQLLHDCRLKKYRMLKHNIGNVENQLFLFVSQKNGYLMFPVDSGTNLVYLDISEPGLLFTFFDFCHNIYDNMFYSSDETVRILHLVLEKFRKH